METTINLTSKDYVGITSIGDLLGATSTWGRKVAARDDFPAPAIRVKTPERDVLYWDSADVLAWSMWWKHRKLNDAPAAPIQPEPEPKPKLAAEKAAVLEMRQQRREAKPRRLSRPEVREATLLGLTPKQYIERHG